MTREQAIECMARSIYEEDDPWHKAWPWPNLQPDQGSPDAYRRLATAALDALTASGMAVVPVEANDRQIHQGASAMDHPSLYMGGPSHQAKRKVPYIYRAMIAASVD